MCVLHQGAINKIIPLLIMGTFSCLGGIVSTTISQCRYMLQRQLLKYIFTNKLFQTALFLPETLFKHLPNTLEEGETFGTKFNIFSCPSNSRQDQNLVLKWADKDSGAARSLAQNLSLALRRSLCDTQTPIQSMIYKIITIMNFKWNWTWPLSVNISFIQRISIATNPAKS